MNYNNFDECFDYFTKNKYFSIKEIEYRKSDIEKLDIDYYDLLNKIQKYRRDNKKNNFYI